MKILTILDHIDSRHLGLPEIQRGYVWTRDQVRGLDSLYRRRPVTRLLVCAAESTTAARCSDGPLAAVVAELALDDQPSITWLHRHGAWNSGGKAAPRRISIEGTMNSLVLWRRISPTDFRAMNGSASPHGRGGGAMHIALGVRTDLFPIDDFLDAAGKTDVAVSAAADPERIQVAQLAFSGNPRRRGGEWRIRDQYTNRHPAWTTTARFPAAYNASNPPYVLVFKIGKSFHARFSLESDILKLSASDRPKGITSVHKGIAIPPPAFVAAFRVPGLTRFEEFQAQQEGELEEAFDPKNLSDGRKRIIAAVIRRLGQRAFRRKLISAYAAQCAMTQCKSLWVLEAAHITPYQGLRTNSVSNGLLLRADVHTLFDLALISIEPSKLLVRVSKLLGGSEYERLDGQQPTLPSKTALHPSTAALEYHYRLFHP